MERDYFINQLVKNHIITNDKKPSAVADKAGIRRDTFSRIINSKRPIYADELVPIILAAGMDLTTVIDEVAVRCAS